MLSNKFKINLNCPQSHFEENEENALLVFFKAIKNHASNHKNNK